MFRYLKRFRNSIPLVCCFILSTLITNGQSSSIISIQDESGQSGILTYDDWNGYEWKYTDSFKNGIWSISHLIDAGDSDLIAIGQYNWDEPFQIFKFKGLENKWIPVFSFDSTAKLRFGSRLFKRVTGEIVGILFIDDKTTSISIFQIDPKTHDYSELAFLPHDSISSVWLDFAYNPEDDLLYGFTSQNGLNNQGYIFSVNLNSGSMQHAFDMNEFGLTEVSARPIDYSKNLGLFGTLIDYNYNGILFRFKDEKFSVLHAFEPGISRIGGSVQVGDTIVAFIEYFYQSNESYLKICDTAGNSIDSQKVDINYYTEYGLKIMGDTEIFILSSSYGTYGGGFLYTYNLKNKTLNHRVNFSSSTGYRPKSYIVKPNGYCLVHLEEGGTNGKGGVYTLNLDNTGGLAAFQGTNSGSKISSRILSLMNDSKVVFSNNGGGLYGKGSIVLMDIPRFETDQIIHLGSEATRNDTALFSPIGKSLIKLDEFSYALICEKGGEYEYGGLIHMRYTNGSWQKSELHFHGDKENILLPSLSHDSAGNVYYWTEKFAPDTTIITLNRWDILSNQSQAIYSKGVYLNDEMAEREGVIKGANYYSLVNTYVDPFGGPRQSGFLLKFNLDDASLSHFEMPVNSMGYKYGNRVVLVQDSLLAFTSSYDYKLGFGALHLFSLNTETFVTYEFEQLQGGVTPVGEIFWNPKTNKLVIACSENGIFGEGAIMEFDLISRQWNKVCDIPTGLGRSLLFDHNPQVLQMDANLLSIQSRDNQNPKIILYPNPANTYVQLTNHEEGEAFSLFSLNGKCCMEGNVSSTGSISIATLSPGIYFLQLKESGQVMKLVKE